MRFHVLRSPHDNNGMHYAGDSTYEIQNGGALRIFDAEKNSVIVTAAGHWYRITEELGEHGYPQNS